MNQEKVTEFVRKYLEKQTSIEDVCTNETGMIIIWSNDLPPSDFYTKMCSDLKNYYNLNKVQWYGCSRSYNQAKAAHKCI